MSDDSPREDPPREDAPRTVSRRTALGLLGAAGAGSAAVPLLGTAAAEAHNPAHGPRPGGGAPPVQGLHLTFGRDPAHEMVVSWITTDRVRRPRVIYGTFDGGYGETVEAQTRSYLDGTSGRTVFVHHAELDRLRSQTDYVYAAQHDGASADAGTFRTAPRGRAPFTFTSFGDQATPLVTWDATGKTGLDANSSPASKDT